MTEEKKFYRVPEAGKKLFGPETSPWKSYDLARRGVIPTVKIGKRGLAVAASVVEQGQIAAPSEEAV